MPRYSNEIIQTLLESSGSEFISVESKVLNSDAKIKFKCKCGKTDLKVLKYLEKSAVCKKCVRATGFRYNTDFLEQIFNNEGATLKGNIPVGPVNRTGTISFKCKCGELCTKTFMAIRFGGAICETCNSKKRFLKISEAKASKFQYIKPNLDILLENQGATLKSKHNHKIHRFDNITYICECGKEHTKQFYAIYNYGAICDICITKRPMVLYKDAPDNIECVNCGESKHKDDYVHKQTTWKQLVTSRCNQCRSNRRDYSNKYRQQRIEEQNDKIDTHKKCNGTCLRILPIDQFIGENIRCIRCNEQGEKSKQKINESKILANQMYPDKQLCSCGRLEDIELFTTEVNDIQGKQCSSCRQNGFEYLDKIRDIYLNLKKSKGPCVDCGEEDIRILEFDHREPENKICNVGSCGSEQTMIIEAEKCEMRCCICHRRRTKQQFKYGTSNKPGLLYINRRKIEIGGCVLCGWFDENLLEALHFDHIDRSTKLCNVSELSSYTNFELIDAEIAKTRLLCAKCDKLHTTQQLGYYLYQDKTRSECRQDRIEELKIKII